MFEKMVIFAMHCCCSNVFLIPMTLRQIYVSESLFLKCSKVVTRFSKQNPRRMHLRGFYVVPPGILLE